MKNLLMSLLLFSITIKCFAQNNDTTSIRKHQFSVGLSVYDYTFREGISFQYYNDSKFKYKFGVSYTPFYFEKDIFIGLFNQGTFASFFGVKYLTEKRFFLFIDMGISISWSKIYQLKNIRQFDEDLVKQSFLAINPTFQNFNFSFIGTGVNIKCFKKISSEVKLIAVRSFNYGLQSYKISILPSVGVSFNM